MSGARQARKQATRIRVLDAARDLFEEAGYEAATVRAIAEKAGVAVGSVFTTFSSKAEILRAVMQGRVESLYAELQRVAPHLRGSCCDQIRSIMGVHYNFEMERPRLYTAYVATSFDWAVANSEEAFGVNPMFRGMIREVLEEGIRKGEVREDLDIELFLDCMLASYGFNYRLAGDHGAAALTARLDKQIGLLFDGAAARRRGPLRARRVNNRRNKAGAEQRRTGDREIGARFHARKFRKGQRCRRARGDEAFARCAGRGRGNGRHGARRDARHAAIGIAQGRRPAARHDAVARVENSAALACGEARLAGDADIALHRVQLDGGRLCGHGRRRERRDQRQRREKRTYSHEELRRRRRSLGDCPA